MRCERGRASRLVLLLGLALAGWGLHAGLESTHLLNRESKASRWARAHYLAACKDYQVRPSADVLAFLRLGTSKLSITRQPFADLDLQPLIEILSQGSVRVRSLDLSGARLGPTGALIAAHLLELPGCRRLERLDLSNQPLGVEGAEALAQAVRVRRSRHLRYVCAANCGFGDRGGSYWVELLSLGQKAHSLDELDLQNNVMSDDMCNEIAAVSDGQSVVVHLEGNRVLDEVLNAVTHGLGVLLAIVGTVFLGCAAKGRDGWAKFGVVLYSISLHVLYLASTLLHSFHALGRTVVYIFGTLDHCAIYILIAGSYCPFLLVLFPGERSAKILLVMLWVTAFSGMAVAALCERGMVKTVVELSLYLGMGWSCVTHMRPLTQRLGPDGTRLLVAGGLAYTLGVPFFVRNGHFLGLGLPDHTIWHVFVLAGSIFHYFAILHHTMTYQPPSAETPRKGPGEMGNSVSTAAAVADGISPSRTGAERALRRLRATGAGAPLNY